MKKIYLIFLLFFISCSPFEIGRIVGMGTRPFKSQGELHSYTFNKDYFSCYEQILTGLSNMGANFYRGGRKEGFIIANHFNGIFKQSTEATEVAVFFEDLGPTQTKVQVSSLNHSLSQFVALKLFPKPQKQ